VLLKKKAASTKGGKDEKTIMGCSIATALLCFGGSALAITTNDAPSPGELVSELILFLPI
jgi:hypothetical protein